MPIAEQVTTARYMTGPAAITAMKDGMATRAGSTTAQVADIIATMALLTTDTSTITHTIRLIITTITRQHTSIGLPTATMIPGPTTTRQDSQ